MPALGISCASATSRPRSTTAEREARISWPNLPTGQRFCFKLTHSAVADSEPELTHEAAGSRPALHSSTIARKWDENVSDWLGVSREEGFVRFATIFVFLFGLPTLASAQAGPCAPLPYAFDPYKPSDLAILRQFGSSVLGECAADLAAAARPIRAHPSAAAAPVPAAPCRCGHSCGIRRISSLGIHPTAALLTNYQRRQRRRPPTRPSPGLPSC